jgi:hypothetical protein
VGPTHRDPMRQQLNSDNGRAVGNEREKNVYVPRHARSPRRPLFLVRKESHSSTLATPRERARLRYDA